MDLSVIIVCHKGWPRLLKCLDSLAAIRYQGFSFEVIVVDNNSGDNEIERIRERYRSFTFILNTINGGFSYGCNTGARNASGKFLLFLNPDTVVTGEAFAGLLKVKEGNPDFTILSCRQVNETGRETHATADFPSFSNLTGIQRSLFGRKKATGNNEVSFPDWVSGSLILMTGREFLATGGFDEDFWMYFEDVDLCRRVTGSGGKVAFHRNITIEHNHGGSSRVNLKTASLTKTEVMISRHVYFSKHSRGLNRMFIETFMVVNNLITCAVMAITGLIMFFIPKAFVRVQVFTRLCSYYLAALSRMTWISPRAVRRLP
jgi:GT2 family glycosyltransferase